MYDISSAAETALVDEIRRRFIAAKFDVTALRIEGLGFRKMGEDCDLSDKPDDIAATHIETYAYKDRNSDGEAYEFKIHRLGKFNGKLWEIVTMHGNYEPHKHLEADAVFVMLQGKGIAIIGNQFLPYDEKSVLTALSTVAHGFITQDPTAFLSIQSTPIVCKPAGANEPRVDFFPVQRPPMPRDAEALYQQNRSLAAPANT